MSSYVYETLNKLRLQVPYTGCDVIFQIGVHEYPAHRAVLLSRMEYFRKTFTEDSTENGKYTVVLDSETIDSTYFSDFLNYVYTSQIDFTEDNIKAISKTADYFCFVELIDKVKKHMKMKNASFVRTISKQFVALTNYNLSRFTINRTPKEEVISNLSFEHLNFVYENSEENDRLEEMFHYSIDWILEDEVNRAGLLLELLKNIPLKSLSFRFLNQIASQYELIRKDDECLKLLFDAIITASKTDAIEKRRKRTEGIYVIGGQDREWFLLSVSRYHHSTGKWAGTTPMPTLQTQFGCAVIGQKIYVCGGFDTDRQCLNKLTVFDTNSQQWSQLTPMKHERFGCAAAVLNGQIYVAGGGNNTDSGIAELAVVERYNAKTDQWSDVSPMNTKRCGTELVAFNGFLYAIGGSNRSLSGLLNSVERYDPQTDQWIVMSDTNHKYTAFGSAVLNGSIYIAGQYTCEVYSLEDDKWTNMPAPSICRGGKRLAVYYGKLYSIGGIDKDSTEWKGIDTVEVFNFQERVWQTGTEMNTLRYLHGVAVVERLLSVSIKKVFDEKRSLNELRLQNIGCDVILEIGGRQFPAHRVVLIARMEYFRNMIPVHSRNEKSVIPLDSESIDPTIFVEILNYIYTSEITFTNENLRPIYKAAEYFRFHELIYKLQEHMEFTWNMNIENVRVYSPIVGEFGVKYLEDLFAQFIIKQTFSAINRRSRKESFPTLLFEDLKENLRNLKENGNLEDMFNYSVEWILHDEVNRSEMLLGLLKDIPLEKLSSDFLIEVVSQNVLVRKNMECIKFLFDAVIKVSTSNSETPRNILFAIRKSAKQSVFEYNSITEKLTATTSIPKTRPGFACAVIGHKIYVCGESNKQRHRSEREHLIDLLVFDTLTRKWTELTPLWVGFARKNFAVAALNGQIYVAGGYIEEIYTDRRPDVLTRKVMRYDVQTDQWEDVASMNARREKLVLVAVNGFLYAIGRITGVVYTNYHKKSVEQYDPKTDRWTKINEIKNGYEISGYAVYNDKIYIVGDNKCEVYNTASNSWTEMLAPSKFIRWPRLAVFNGKLYAIGTYKMNSSDTVEMYDFETRVWKPEPKMNALYQFDNFAVVKQ